MTLLCVPPYRSSGSHVQTPGPAFELVKALTSRCANLLPTSKKAANGFATPCHFAAQLPEPPAAKTCQDHMLTTKHDLRSAFVIALLRLSMNIDCPPLCLCEALPVQKRGPVQAHDRGQRTHTLGLPGRHAIS